MIDYVEAIRRESARFLDVLGGADPARPVPACPEWSAADLLWHLTEVQEFWAAIAGGLLEDPSEVVKSPRPADAELAATFRDRSGRLVEALGARRPEEACWSWHAGGESIGWVRRRQAHEALIHRIDAELTVGAPSDVDPALAADGVDEVLRVMLDAVGLPEWSAFTPDGSTVALEVESGRRWAMELGRFAGTSPTSGNSYDEPAVRLIDGERPATATIRGAAAAVDLWLWGRADREGLTVEGPDELVGLVREAAAAGTQ